MGLHESKKLSRRDFLQAAGVSAATATIYPGIFIGILEAFSAGHTLMSSEERRLLQPPRLLTDVQNNSIICGSHPHQNSLKIALESAEVLRRKPQILGFFAKTYRPFSADPELLATINNTAEAGILPLISWGEKIPTANQDIELLIDQLKEIKCPFLLRPWFEMQGSWARGKDGWYGNFTDQEFIYNWQIMRVEFKQKLPNAYFVFSPNSTDIADSFEKLFPHPDYVDVIGLDAYNKHSPSLFDPRHYLCPNLRPEQVFGPDIATCQRIAPNTPWMLTELGSIDTPNFTRDAIDYAIRAGAAAWMTFEWNKRHLSWNEADWQVSSNPLLVDQLRQELSQDHYFRNQCDGIDAVYETLHKLLNIH